MQSLVRLGLAVALVVACGGARADAPKSSRPDAPSSFAGTWNVATVLYRDSSSEDTLRNRRERLFHKNVSLAKNAATLLDRTCTTSRMTVAFEDADAEASRRHVSKNDLGIITTKDRLLVASVTCKSSGGDVEEKLYRRVRDGKLDGGVRMVTPDFLLGLDPK